MPKGKAAVLAELKDENVDKATLQKVAEAIDRNFPEKIYTVAVWFLGVATLLLIIGAVMALLMVKPSSDALWTAIGAGLGALAGIFTARNA